MSSVVTDHEPTERRTPFDEDPTPMPSPRRIGRIDVVPPDPRDPRLHTSIVLLSVQALGQVALDFDLSITQILTSIGCCAVIEIAVQARRRHALVWPASALLTGNGIALLLRAPGTQHADWWSTNGLWVFVLAALVAMTTKYLIVHRNHHVFNPSNIGLVTVFLVVGVRWADPQDLWWGPRSPGLAVTYIILLAGGIAITRRLRLLGIAASFWMVYSFGIAVLAVAGHSMEARWSLNPVQGWDFWWIMATSPEILIFLFFMITDPRTVPASARGRRWFGAVVGLTCVVLVAPQATEFATKVAIIGSLAIVCAALPVARAIETGRRPTDARALRLISHPTLAAVGLVALLIALAVNHRAPGVDATLTPADGGVSVDPSDMPTVEVIEREDVNGRLDEDEANRVVRDVVEGLAVAQRARDRDDRDLATTVLTGEALDRWAEGPSSSAAGSHFSNATVSIVRSGGQSLPSVRVGLESDSGDESLEITVAREANRYMIERIVV